MTKLHNNKAAAALVLAGILFLVIGVYRGEVEVVIRKSVNICMECIGLG